MKLIKKIKDREVKDDSGFRIRKASRAILFDDKKLVPIIYVSEFNYHKLPGGGIEEGESREEALEREMYEEVGSEIKIMGEVGKSIEHRTELNLKQISYCYFGQITKKGETHYTDKEIEEGFSLIWLPLDKAIFRLQTDKPENYEGLFIQKRDLAFLLRTKDLIEKAEAEEKKEKTEDKKE